MSDSIVFSKNSLEFRDISDNILNSIVCDANGNLDISGGTLIGNNDLTIARTNGLQTALDLKQDLIGNNDLTIARTNGLQTALDEKAPKENPTFTGNTYVNIAGSASGLKISGVTAEGHHPLYISCFNTIGAGDGATETYAIDVLGKYSPAPNHRSHSARMRLRAHGTYSSVNLMCPSPNHTALDIYNRHNNRIFYINESGVAWAGSGGILSSDNRTKHNEVDILNALTTINKLSCKFYIKTISIKDVCGNEYDVNHNFTENDLSNGLPEFSFYESGYIAQDISNIAELNHLVSGSEYDQSGNPTPLALNYTGIQPYLTKAIQELHALVLEQKQQILDLSAQVAALS